MGFWAQLQKWQQNRTPAADLPGKKAQQQLPASFNYTWATASCAAFGMGSGTRTLFLSGLPKTVESALAAIPAALDFVLGRRATRKTDLDWLAAVCAALPASMDATACIEDLLRPCSEFAKLWEGELLARDVKQIMAAIPATSSHAIPATSSHACPS